MVPKGGREAGGSGGYGEISLNGSPFQMNSSHNY